MKKSADTDFPIHGLLSERWSSRSFAEDGLTLDELGGLLEAARWAPSCHNEQPWAFPVAAREDRDGFERSASCLKEGNSWARRAPVLILTVARTAFVRDGEPNRHALHDVGLASGNLVLQAEALGLATHQMAGFDAARAAAAGLPEGYEPVTMIAVGRRSEPEELPDALREREVAPRSRRPLGDGLRIRMGHAPVRNRGRSRVMARGALASALAAACSTGCATTALPDDVVLQYDETVSRAQAEMLVLNVARSRHGRPLHFTTVSGIAATFGVRADATLGGELAEDAGISLLTPEVGFGVSASPTISIIPVQGEEFTKRLLTPLDQSTLGFFYHQGIDVSMLVRLMAQTVILERDGGRDLIPTRPGSPRAETFRSLLATLDALGEAQRLDVGPLVFDESWTVPGDRPASASELADLIDRGYGLAPREGGVALTRRVVGRQAITDYDPATLPNEELAALEQRAQEYPSYFVLLDLRGAGTGGEPVRGWIKLRSLASVIESIAAETISARTIGDPDSSAPPLVVESERPLHDNLFTVRYEGLSYSVPRSAAPAFRTLYSLFEMAVSEVPVSAVPSVTIAK